jgi:hypothetical protein
LCYQFQPTDDFMRIYIALDSTTTACNADHLSPFIDVCDRTAPCPTGLSFSDLPTSNTFYGSVTGLVSVGAASGYSDGTFRPNANTTRAQLAKIIVSAFGLTLTNSATAHFADVPSSNPFFAYVETAYAHNLISGYGDGLFRPYSDVTRGAVAKMVVGAAGYALVSPTTASFSDVAVGSTYYSYVETAYAHHLISGYADGTFRAQSSATRAQIAQVTMLASSVQTPLLPWGKYGSPR